MTREEAKEYVKGVLKTANGKRIALVLRRYFEKFGKQSTIETAKRIFSQ